MGQYYLIVILAEKSDKSDKSDKEYIRTYLDPTMYTNGMKLTEHSYIGNNFMKIVENLIGPSGMFHKSRIVWAGDYADAEPNSESNLNGMCRTNTPFVYNEPVVSYTYIVNHTKKVYVKKNNEMYIVASEKLVFHPLALLTAEGNGRGGGDYNGPNKDMVGTWARDVISMENEAPDYTLIECVF